MITRARTLRDEPGRPTIIAEYTPPRGIDALESAVLLGRTTKAIPAEVLEQAVVGSIRIVEGERRWFGGTRLKAQLIDPSRADGDGRMLLDGLFPGLRPARSTSSADRPTALVGGAEDPQGRERRARSPGSSTAGATPSLLVPMTLFEAVSPPMPPSGSEVPGPRSTPLPPLGMAAVPLTSVPMRLPDTRFPLPLIKTPSEVPGDDVALQVVGRPVAVRADDVAGPLGDDYAGVGVAQGRRAADVGADEVARHAVVAARDRSGPRLPRFRR